MKPHISLKVLVALAFSVLLAAPAMAELTEFETGIAEAPSQISFGLGAAMVPDYEGSNDYTVAPLVLFQYKAGSGRFIDLLGNRVKFNLVASREFQFGPVLQYRATRDDDVNDDQVKLMKEVDTAIEAGVFANIDINSWLAGVQVVTDVSDSHDGTLVTINGGYRWNVGPTLTLVPGVSGTWASEDYMSTYFSINDENRGTSTLADFNADAGVKDVTVSLIADYHPWQNWKIMAGAGFKTLLGDARDSPVVEKAGDASQFVVGVLLAYTWR